MTRFLTSFLFISFTLVAPGQSSKSKRSNVYHIKLAGVEIGTLTTTEQKEDSITTLIMDSTVDFWVLVSVNVKHLNTSIYRGNQLTSSISSTTTSKGNFTSTVVWKKDKYEVHVNNYEYTNNEAIRKPIYGNVSSLYFKEPVGVQEVLADGYGKICAIKRLSAGVYEVDVLGNKNKYFYENGILVRASMYSKFKNYEVVLHHDED